MFLSVDLTRMMDSSTVDETMRVAEILCQPHIHETVGKMKRGLLAERSDQLFLVI